jgi:hypothetical protein
MRRTGDPLAESFANLDNKQLLADSLEQLKREYGASKR